MNCSIRLEMNFYKSKQFPGGKKNKKMKYNKSKIHTGILKEEK